MDKYEFNIKVEQIKKLVNKGDYETAMKIADTIDWRRVRSTSLLTMVAQVYERNEEYQDAKDILLLAFERAPIGKGLLFKLTDLALREGNIKEAEAYYREFCDLAGEDPRENLLRFLILEAKEAPIEQQINSLERYCEEELDEKWLYHLAELYQQAGREDDCVKICDKIMLMFGLGKYVDKAMELKLQYAPLTKYQMDLVENREKYEEKLRAVEEKYENGVYRGAAEDEDYYDSDDTEDETDISVRKKIAAGSDPDEPLDMEKAEQISDDPERSLDEDVVASIHEANAEQALAREVSRMEPYAEDESSSIGETRVLENIRDIHGASEETAAAGEREPAEESVHEFEEEEETIVEDWDLEPEEQEGLNHLMIEAEEPEKGLALALESLKKIHREMGTKNPVAKISGENLSRRGIFSVADRLTGKDLVIERAADLDPSAVDELYQLMEKNGSDMVVVLIDTPARLERMHSAYPLLAGKFQYIGCEKKTAENDIDAREKELLRRQAEMEAEAARKRLAEREEEIRRQAARDAEDARRRQAEKEEDERRQAEIRRREEELRQEEARRQEEERLRAEEAYRQEEIRRQAEYEAENAARFHAEREADEAKRQEEYEEEMRRRDSWEEADEEQFDESSENQDNYETDEYAREEEKEAGQLDVEEFVQYACKYASEIDCSISGKSMLALYERAEMMEEDGVPLTKIAAEDLIEEAADKAEKKSFGGLFSSKYDKDGLLILKEKHFFD